MKFTLSWLKTHLDTDATLGQITATLTRIGLELEGQGSLLLYAESFPDPSYLPICFDNPPAYHRYLYIPCRLC